MSADPTGGGSPGPLEGAAIGIRDDLTRLDSAFEPWLSRYGVRVLGYALAAVFFWFGTVEPLGISPSDPVVHHGVFLSFDLLFPVLGWWEAFVGVGLLFDRTVRYAAYLMAFRMLGTMIPLFTTPWMPFVDWPLVPSEVGAYITKHWVVLGSAMVVVGRLDEATD